MSEKNDERLPRSARVTPDQREDICQELWSKNFDIGIRMRHVDPLVDSLIESDSFGAVLAAVWEAGFDACANWWEIHHHGTVRDELNPYTPAVGGQSPVSLEGDK